MKILAVYTVLFVNVGAYYIDSTEDTRQIDDVDISLLPYHVLIELKFGNKTATCSGAVIGIKAVLTAAQCVYRNSTKVLVKSGSSIFSEGKISEVASIKIHPKFRPSVLKNDIAVLNMRTTIPDSLVIPLAASEPKPETNFLMSGWERTKEYQYLKPTRLQGDIMVIVNRNSCNKTYQQYNYPVRETNICADHLNKRSKFCHGNRGSPLVANDEIVGVGSFGSRRCGINGDPAVFSSVFKYRNWIESVAKI